jgi:hypothetical protein
MSNCFDVQDCSDVGFRAGASVANEFCMLPTDDSGWLPEKCRIHAETSCKSDAVNIIQEFTVAGKCSTVVDANSVSALDFVDEIHYMCEEQVYEMEQSATLVWHDY